VQTPCDRRQALCHRVSSSSPCCRRLPVHIRPFPHLGASRMRTAPHFFNAPQSAFTIPSRSWNRVHPCSPDHGIRGPEGILREDGPGPISESTHPHASLVGQTSNIKLEVASSPRTSGRWFATRAATVELPLQPKDAETWEENRWGNDYRYTVPGQGQSVRPCLARRRRPPVGGRGEKTGRHELDAPDRPASPMKAPTRIHPPSR